MTNPIETYQEAIDNTYIALMDHVKKADASTWKCNHPECDWEETRDKNAHRVRISFNDHFSRVIINELATLAT